MSTITSKSLILTDSSKLKPIAFAKLLTPILHFVLVLAAISLCFYNVWAGVSLFIFHLLFVTRKMIRFFFYILSLDFTMEEDIFHELESM